MAVSIDQRPLYKVLPIGQQIIFSVSESQIVATKFKVKFIAEIHVSNTAINLSSTTDIIGTFKTTPNNAGVGIFDLRPILETFISPDNEPSSATSSTYKGIASDITTFPIHLVDKYSLSEKSIKYFAIQFKIEYAESASGVVLAPGQGGNTLNAENSAQYTMFNGVLQYDDVLTKSLFGNDYGYNLQNFELTDNDSQFLSNAPTTQYARLTDYGTLPFLNYVPLSSTPASSVDVDWITITYYKADGSSAGGTDNVLNTAANGGAASAGDANTRLSYFGAFPANLQNWSANFATAVTNDLAYYTVQAQSANLSQIYTVNILCPNLKGFEAIRLAWLNQWGTWDYYTFNMKSTRTIATKRTSYTQLSGTWNESTFRIADYKGGKKNFRVNSTEKITLNTDFVTEAEGVWFEELINSNAVYIVNGFSSDVANTITNKYIDPVVLTTSSYVKKTIANDKVMQYTIEIEKSKMKRTQAV
tara:strand:+ start:830 stop:2251 length:1422 start_codon:yes stop_codon:yes gene_type:complete